MREIDFSRIAESSLQLKELAELKRGARDCLLALMEQNSVEVADRLVNFSHASPPYHPTEEAEELHSRLQVVDMHADQLLWNRDLLRRNKVGHVDLPRLRDGNVAIQVLAAVTSVPFGKGKTVNDDYWDLISTLGKLSNWPDNTKESFLNRALHQRDKLDEYIEASQGGLRLITDRAQLNELLDQRREGDDTIGVMLAVEGIHVLDKNTENLEVLFDAGFRMLGMNHFVENVMSGGGAEGSHRYGLTDEGREMVHAALDMHMIIDLAHSSDETIHDVVGIAREHDKPVLVSHTGVRGTCDTNRNLGPAQIREIASTRGVIGIGLFDTAICGTTVQDTARAMRYVIDLVGEEAVALGSDFDGMTPAAVDCSGLAMLTQALQEPFCRNEWKGETALGYRCKEPRADGAKADSSQEETEYIRLSDDQIKKIMGKNAIRVFEANLP